MKSYTIIKYRNNRQREITGTLEELKERFAYHIECGCSWNSKINDNPKTIKSFVKTINECAQELQRGNFNQDYYELKQ